MNQAPNLDWSLGVAIALLLAVAIASSTLGKVTIERDLAVATVRAVVQLAAVAAIVAVVLDRTWAAGLFATSMFAVAVATTSGRVRAGPDWPWVAVALASCVVPVLTIIFALQAAACTGTAIIPIAGIVIGGSMTAHTLTARRAFDALRSGRGQVEAGLALGLSRPSSIRLVIARHAAEGVIPVIDQTRTVGLVALPGTFIGVLLGGGSAGDAAAAQILVLVGLLAAETSVVVVAQRLIANGRILPADLRRALPPR